MAVAFLAAISLVAFGFALWEVVTRRPRPYGPPVPPRLSPVAAAELTEWLQWLIIRLCQEEAGQATAGDSDLRRVWLLRLSGVVLTAIAKHRLDARGRCAGCQPSTGWRGLITRLSPPRPCVVQSAAELFLRRGADVAWWLALEQAGEPQTLTAVRTWLRGTRVRRQQAGAVDEGRHSGPDPAARTGWFDAVESR